MKALNNKSIGFEQLCKSGTTPELYVTTMPECSVMMIPLASQRQEYILEIAMIWGCHDQKATRL